MNVVILAAGGGSRYEYSPKDFSVLTKCLLPLNGENILQRQVRLLKQHLDGGIIAVVPPKFPVEVSPIGYKFLDVNKHEVTWTIKRCKKYIREPTFILLGDVVFTEETLKEILNEPFDDTMFVGWKELLRPNVWQGQVHAVLTKDGKRFVDSLELDNKLFRELLKKKVKLFTPNGFIRDVDFHKDLTEIREWIKKHES